MLLKQIKQFKSYPETMLAEACTHKTHERGLAEFSRPSLIKC